MLESRQLLTTCTVSNLSDGVNAVPIGSLRDCLDNSPQPSAITFTSTLSGTINLQGALPTIAASMTITGPSSGLVTINRFSGGDYSIIRVENSSSVLAVTISFFTIQNGIAVQGGGIFSTEDLTLNWCSARVSWCSARVSDPAVACDRRSPVPSRIPILVSRLTLFRNKRKNCGLVCRVSDRHTGTLLARIHH